MLTSSILEEKFEGPRSLEDDSSYEQKIFDFGLGDDMETLSDSTIRFWIGWISYVVIDLIALFKGNGDESVSMREDISTEMHDCMVNLSLIASSILFWNWFDWWSAISEVFSQSISFILSIEENYYPEVCTFMSDFIKFRGDFEGIKTFGFTFYFLKKANMDLLKSLVL